MTGSNTSTSNVNPWHTGADLRKLGQLLAIVLGGVAVAGLVFFAEIDLWILSKDIKASLISNSGNGFDMASGAGTVDPTVLDRLIVLGVNGDGASGDDVDNLFAATNARFGAALINTVLIATVVSMVMPGIVFALSSFSDYFKRRGRNLVGRLIELQFDLIPYIIWPLVLAGIARAVYGDPNLFGIGLLVTPEMSKTLSHVLSVTIQYFGYAAFLIIFQFKVSSRWIEEIGNTEIVDGMRVAGLRMPAIYFRLFRLGYMRRLYGRQVCYTFVFVLLFDFSISLVHPFTQAGGPQMVFAVSSQIERMRDDAETDVLLGNSKVTFIEATSLLSEAPGIADADRALFSVWADRPFHFLESEAAGQHLEDIAYRHCKPAHVVPGCLITAILPEISNFDAQFAFVFGGPEQRLHLFDVLSRFYLFLGVSLIGAALLILLVRFDLPELLDER